MDLRGGVGSEPPKGLGKAWRGGRSWAPVGEPGGGRRAAEQGAKIGEGEGRILVLSVCLSVCLSFFLQSSA